MFIIVCLSFLTPSGFGMTRSFCFYEARLDGTCKFVCTFMPRQIVPLLTSVIPTEGRNLVISLQFFASFHSI